MFLFCRPFVVITTFSTDLVGFEVTSVSWLGQLTVGVKSSHRCKNMIFKSIDIFSNNFKIKIYKTIILPVVLCGCETWSLTLRDVYRLRVFENMIPRQIFGPKRMGSGEGSTVRNYIVYTVHLI